MEENIFTCPKGCCVVKIRKYTKQRNPFYKIRRKGRKAGAFIYDPKTNKVLLVQSRGHLWGPPKGTLNYAETESNCAIREVKEETGLSILTEDFKNSTAIKSRAMYFYVEKDECDVKVQSYITDNDANGISWIKVDCLQECIERGNISVTQHCRVLFRRFMNGYEFAHSTFILVGKQKRSSRF
jgi:8-oxo-dGTP pyrophosphatase MutT (NUDIX family)